MTDRDRALAVAREVFWDFGGLINESQKELFARRISNLILEARAEESEGSGGGGDYWQGNRAAQLRSQKGGE